MERQREKLRSDTPIPEFERLGQVKGKGHASCVDSSAQLEEMVDQTTRTFFC